MAYALAGADTAAMQTYSDENAREQALVSLRDRARVDPDDSVASTAAIIDVRLKGGQTVTEQADVGVPAQNFDLQWDRLEAKFLSLVEPVMGPDKATEIVKAVAGLHHLSVREMMATLC